MRVVLLTFSIYWLLIVLSNFNVLLRQRTTVCATYDDTLYSFSLPCYSTYGRCHYHVKAVPSITFIILIVPGLYPLL